VPDPLRPLRVNALELLRQPGSERVIQDDISADALGIDHPLLRGDVGVDYRLESLADGIVVHGVARARWAGECRRCLKPIEGTDEIAVDELYQVELTDEDAFPIENNQLDLAPMTRELVLLALDEERLHAPDCAGLCPVCGSDRNEVDCGCDTTVRDDRWAVLDELKIED
jgi:uncharacterized protein